MTYVQALCTIRIRANSSAKELKPAITCRMRTETLALLFSLNRVTLTCGLCQWKTKDYLYENLVAVRLSVW